MPFPHFEILVEEVSMKAFLDALLPRMLPKECTFKVFPYGGKCALIRKLGDRLNGYASWITSQHRIVVIVDRDSDDCEDLKSRLEEICNLAGLRSRSVAEGDEWQVVTRIAVEELEAWYFGGWPAVCAAFPRVSPKIPDRASYRNPDAITGGTWEAFERILQRHGYHKQGLLKVRAATEIGKNFDWKCNRSHSFAVFRDAILEVAHE